MLELKSLSLNNYVFIQWSKEIMIRSRHLEESNYDISIHKTPYYYLSAAYWND